MPDPADLSALTSAVDALRQEVVRLRSELDELKGRRPQAAAAPPPVVQATQHCKFCGAAVRDLASHSCGEIRPKPPQPAAAVKSAPPVPPPPPLRTAPPPSPAPKPLEPWEKPRTAPSGSGLGERFIGEQVLHYLGLTLLALGAAYFLVWRAMHTSPLERLLLATGTGLALLGLAAWFRGRPPYGGLANSVAGGGWTILLLTAYAASHFEATRVVHDPMLAAFLIVATAVCMAAHALQTGSRAMRIFAFGLSYFVFFFGVRDTMASEVFALLLAGSAYVAVSTGHADVLVVSVLGYWANMSPNLFGGVAGAFPERFLPVLLGYLIVAWLPAVPKARSLDFEAAGCINAMAFAVTGFVMINAAYTDQLTLRIAALGAVVVLPSLAYLKLLPRDSALSQVSPAVALALIAAGVFHMPNPLWKMLAWIGVSASWIWIGLFSGHPAWRVVGGLMAMLTFAFYFWVLRVTPENRLPASTALFLFSGLSYAFSRMYRLWSRGAVQEWERPIMEYWLYAGTAALLLAMWGVLDAAPFAIALVGCAIVGEHAALQFERPHLFLQATAVSLGAFAYSFFVDYGANLPIAGPLSPRLTVALCQAAAFAYFVHYDPVPADWADKTFPGHHARHRAWMSWAVMVVLGYAVYKEFGPRARLPLWSAGTILLYLVGRAKHDSRLKHQAAVLTGIAAFEGMWSYLLHPEALLTPPGMLEKQLYWGACIALLANFVLSRIPVDEKGLDDDDINIGHLSSLLSIGMIAFYLAKEFDRLLLTFSWSVEGLVFLVAGIVLDQKELRFPALLLLATCVGKAVLLDTSGLPLPYRVLSFVALGAVLLVSSTLYVRTGKRD